MVANSPPKESSSGGSRDERELEAARLLGEYVELRARGEISSIDQFLSSRSELPEEIVDALRFLGGAPPGTGWRPVPFEFGDFRILREAGRGGMGVVYEAIQVSLDRRVALKVLPPGFLPDTKAVARFHREAKITASLHHPNIVTVHATGVEDGTPYYAMEYAEGSTLQMILSRLRGEDAGPGYPETTDVSRSGGNESTQVLPPPEGAVRGLSPRSFDGLPLPESFLALVRGSQVGSRHRAEALEALDPRYYRWVARLFAGAADGLQEAHAHGVVHRDLKPSNLILDISGRLRILDFGLAFVEGQATLTLPRERLGTPLYMSPEQAQGLPVLYGPATDIYSLGATLYEMAVLRPPVEGRSSVEILQNLIHRDPIAPHRLNRKVPRDLETIVLSCLKKDPRDRYISAAALAEDLRRFVEGRAIAAKPEALPERILRRAWAARRGIAQVLGALVIVVSVILLVSTYVGGLRERKDAAYDDLVRSAALETMKGQLLSFRHSPAKTEGRRLRTPSPRQGAVVVSQHDGGSMDLFELGASVFEAGAPAAESGPDPAQTALERLASAAAIIPDRPVAHYHAARALLLQGKRAEAKSRLEESRGKDPRFLPSMALLCALLEEEGDPRASSEIEEFSRLAALRGNEWALHSKAAQTALIEKDWGGVARAYERIEGISGETGKERYAGCLVETLLGRGVALFNAGDLDGALESFGAAKWYCQLNWPGVIEPSLFLGRVHLLRKSPEKADNVFSEAYGKVEASLRGRAAHAIARTCLDVGEHDLALRWSARMEPGAPQLSLRGEIQSRMGQREEAIAAGKEAVALSDGDPNAHLSLGSTLMAAGRIDEARAEFERAAGLAPSDGRPLVALGICLDAAGRVEEAMEVLRKAAVSDQSSRAHYTLAGILSRTGDPDGALSSYQEALEHDPGNALALNNMGTILDLRGDIDGALRAYQSACRVAPTLAMAHYNLAWAFHRQRRFGDAAREYERAIRFGMAEDPVVRNNLGPCLQRLRDYQAAFREYMEAIRLDKTNHLAYHSLGTLFEWQGDLPGSLPYFEQAVKIEPRWIDARNDFGFALQRLGRLEEAMAQYEEIFRLEPKFVWAHNNWADAILRNRRPLPEGDALEAALVRLEDARDLPNASPGILSLVGRCSRRLLPRLASYASVDRLLDGPEELIPEGAPWRFRRGTAGAVVGCDWTAADFDDSLWEEGPGPFGYPAGPDVSTVLEDMQGAYTLLYLRRRFEVPDDLSIARLSLVARIDAGLVVHLNGKEVARLRAGSVGQEVPSGAVADRSENEPWLWRELPLGVGDLRAGANLIAIVALNNEIGSSGFLVSPVLEVDTARDEGRLRRMRSRLEEFRWAANEPRDRPRVLYFEGRILAAAGDAEGARRRFREVVELDPSRPEPFLRLAECEGSLGDLSSREATLRRALEAGLERSDDLWTAWFRAATVDLRRDAEEVLEGIPACPSATPEGVPSLHADIAWALGCMVADGALRINCGGGGFRSKEGARWSADRCYRGGLGAFLMALATGEHPLDEPALYQTERWFHEPEDPVDAYRIPLTCGRYRVALHFVEATDRPPDGRAFSIVLEGKEVEPDCRPVSGGFGVPLVMTFPVSVEDGFLDIAFGRKHKSPEVVGIEVVREGP